MAWVLVFMGFMGLSPEDISFDVDSVINTVHLFRPPLVLSGCALVFSI